MSEKAITSLLRQHDTEIERWKADYNAERALADDLADALRRFHLEVELLLARYRKTRLG